MKKALLAFGFLLTTPLVAAPPMVDMMSYFVGSVGACMAADPSNAGTFDSQQLDTTTCPGRRLVVHTLGAPDPWGFEVSQVTPQFIRLYEGGGYSNVYDGWKARVLYVGGRAVGIKWAARFAPTWDFGPYNDQWYAGDATCSTDPNPPTENWPGVPFPAWAVTERWPSFLLDQRSGEPRGPYDIDVVRVNNQEGPTTETYIYGRWTDPVDGAEKGLGLVGFEVHVLHPDGQTVATHLDHYAYIVACAPKVPCFRCPDPPDHLVVTARPDAPVPQKHQQEIQ